MKFAAQFLLILFFVILFFVGLLAGTLKFQLLNFDFWKTSFEKNNVYQNLAVASKGSLESQIGKEGGSKKDAKVLTDLITTENAKDFVDNNIKNLLSFANGKASQLIVYIPVKIIPKNVLPKNIEGIQDQMPLQDLLKKLNYQNADKISLKGLGSASLTANLVFFGSLTLLLVILILLVLLVESGGRLVAPGVAIFLTGVLTISASRIGDSLKTVSLSDPATSSTFAYVLGRNLFQPLVVEFMKTWFILGLVLVAISILLFFVKKPS